MLARGLTRAISVYSKTILRTGTLSQLTRIPKPNISSRQLHSTPALLKIYYTEDHEWVSVADGRIGTVGITQHAQDQLGDIVFCELPEVGDDIEKGDTMGVVESVKAASDLYAPVSGNVEEINQTVLDTPGTINEDPTGEGWMIKVVLSDDSELDGLMDEDEYNQFVEESS